MSVASPADLRAAPSTAGRPPRGIDVRLLDDDDREVGRGETGRIFVRSPLAFDGYTDGGHARTVVDGFMQTGDTGHFDARGRLFVDGRDDDMIISGGENVFPRRGRGRDRPPSRCRRGRGRSASTTQSSASA